MVHPDDWPSGPLSRKEYNKLLRNYYSLKEKNRLEEIRETYDRLYEKANMILDKFIFGD